MEAEDKIIKGKIDLQSKNPFFAYLILHLKQKREDTVETMGVDVEENLYYNKEFVEKLTENDVVISLCHEILHLALNHLTRKGNRDEKLWNISCDLIVNKVLQLNFRGDFDMSYLAKEGVTEESLRNNFGITITDVEKKTAEEIYDIIYNHFNKNSSFKKYAENYNYKHFNMDDLPESKKKELERKYGKSFSEIKRDVEGEIRKKVVEAKQFSKIRGKGAFGLERFFDKLLDFKLNWKQILRKYITDNLPFDYSYKYPSRKSVAVGTYLPTSIRDKKLEVVCVVDLSGSITDDELNEFMTEIYGISKSFKNVDITVITHDDEPHDVIEVKNGCIDKLLNIKLHGLGGTSHSWLPQYLDKNYPNSKLIVCFTDGYTVFPDEAEMGNRKVLWVLCKESVDNEGIPYGDVVRINE